MQTKKDLSASRYMKYVTDYTDKTKTVAALEVNPYLGKLAADFCTVFGCKVGMHSQTGDYVGMAEAGEVLSTRRWVSVSVYTTGGKPVGILRALNVPTAEREYVDEEYAYASTMLVSKQRSRGSRNERTSKKVSSLIRAVKKESNEAPTDTHYDLCQRSGITAAISAIRQTLRSSNLNIMVSAQAVTAMVKNFLGKDATAVETHRGDIQKSYDNYMAECRKFKDYSETMKRFGKGFKAIGFMRDALDGALVYNVDSEGNATRNIAPFPFVLYCEGTFGVKLNSDGSVHSNEQPQLTGGMKRYERVEDIPGMGVDLAIIKAGMEGNSRKEKAHPMLFPTDDEYYIDVDVATGYQYHTAMWVVIPTTPYEPA